MPRHASDCRCWECIDREQRAVASDGNRGEPSESILRAMALNYTDRHAWDSLDAQACIDAANEIKRLRALSTAPAAQQAGASEEPSALGEAADLVDAMGAAKSKGEMLALAFKYRASILATKQAEAARPQDPVGEPVGAEGEPNINVPDGLDPQQSGWVQCPECLAGFPLKDASYNLAAPLTPALRDVLTTCNCRWNGETKVQQCELHQAWEDTLHENGAELRELRDVLAERKRQDDRDAARYRWLRGPDQESTRYSRWRVEYWDGPNGWQPVQRESMDAAVDAALAVAAKETKE